MKEYKEYYDALLKVAAVTFLCLVCLMAGYRKGKRYAEARCGQQLDTIINVHANHIYGVGLELRRAHQANAAMGRFVERFYSDNLPPYLFSQYVSAFRLYVDLNTDINLEHPTRVRYMTCYEEEHDRFILQKNGTVTKTK